MIGTDLNIAHQHLTEGHIIAIPTETVYGLAGNALDASVVATIFEAKNRPAFDPLIVHTHSLEEAMKYVEDFPSWATSLARAFWPGPLTLLLTRKQIIPDIVTNGSDLVGLRVPKHPITLSLLRSLPFPVAAPSANPFGYISPTLAQHVADQLGNKIPYILDGGPSEVGLESTIVGLKEGKPSIFRTGGISIEMIESILGEKVSVLQSTSNPQAPGMLESHYAPRKPLYFGDVSDLISKNAGKKIGILTFKQDLSPSGHVSITLSKMGRLSEAASKLFASLRELDQMDIDAIVAEVFPNEGLGRAINDRLKRASANTKF